MEESVDNWENPALSEPNDLALGTGSEHG